MAKDNYQPNIKQIIVKPNEIDIEADLEDNWFEIIDRDNDWYDDMGAIVFNLDDLKDLIDGLMLLHEDWRARQDNDSDSEIEAA